MIKSFFATNVWLKIASLILAVTLWLFVILSGRSEVIMDIPLAFTNIPSNLDVVESPKTIKVSIEGQESLLKNLDNDEITAVVDLSDTKPGRAFFTISKDNITLPKTFIVTSINPETISLRLESQLKKTVSVKPSVFGVPEKGFAIVNIRVIPEKIELEGPKSEVSKIYNIKTEPLDINGINSDLKYKANLNISNPNIRKNVNKVEVHISIKKIL